MMTPRQTAIRVLITVALAFLLAVGFNTIYTKRSTDHAKKEALAATETARREAATAQHRWCDLLVLLDDLNAKQPTSPSEDITKYRKLIHELRVANNC